MKDQFYLHFPTMPKGTAQQKGYNRKTGRYFKKSIKINNHIKGQCKYWKGKGQYFDCRKK